jgi:hypothetical protein
MAQPGMLWRHVVINTFATWLHGDQRGFRSRKDRIHSSGDYRHRPPKGEHAGLQAYQLGKSRVEVTIERDLRPVVGRAILEFLLGKHYRVLALAVGKVHGHALVELPEGIRTVRAIVGDMKRLSSRAVRDQLPGSVWAAGATYKRVVNDDHLAGANDYILFEQGSGAWTWSFRDRSREGVFGRKRPATPKQSQNAHRESGAARSTALPRRVGERSASTNRTQRSSRTRQVKQSA